MSLYSLGPRAYARFKKILYAQRGRPIYKDTCHAGLTVEASNHKIIERGVTAPSIEKC